MKTIFRRIQKLECTSGFGPAGADQPQSIELQFICPLAQCFLSGPLEFWLLERLPIIGDNTHCFRDLPDFYSINLGGQNP